MFGGGGGKGDYSVIFFFSFHSDFNKMIWLSDPLQEFKRKKIEVRFKQVFILADVPSLIILCFSAGNMKIFLKTDFVFTLSTIV